MNNKINTIEQRYSLQIDYIVDQHYSEKEEEKYQQKKVYSSIQTALDNVKGDSATIFISKGVYDEKIEIEKPSITLIGEDRDKTVVTYDVASGTEKSDGTTYGTFGSASVTVREPNFTAINMTFENSFDYINEYRKRDDDPTKVSHIQAVAFRTTDKSDNVMFGHCCFRGYQDTLLVDTGTHYFTNCVIEGAVDFIFGSGQAVFEACDIVSLDRGETENNGFITAASTSIDVPYGYLFESCKLLKESTDMADDTVYLGRPWHPGGDPDAQASVLFYQCNMEAHIKAQGWKEMGGFSPMEARLYEYSSQGAGASLNDKRRRLTKQEAERFRDYLLDCCVRNRKIRYSPL
ncbi:pectinesterase family protein [Gracilibacillus lacisalsi]|uniref:pectinesterase family protein n=1 Tax=Gracilibacillus lacisalsi TaxID=393087 RepID=UPI00037781EA|nr:pectinesterase family protein [Gracilibacillus lacisalsi]